MPRAGGNAGKLGYWNWAKGNHLSCHAGEMFGQELRRGYSEGATKGQKDFKLLAPRP